MTGMHVNGWHAAISNSRLPRLGQISFINCLPVVLPIEKGFTTVSAETILASPSELNAAYASGALDLGGMSSYFYLQSINGRTLELIPDLSISSAAASGSVLFFSKVEAQHLAGATIAVPACSATSINLLAVLLREEFAADAHFVVRTVPDLEDDKIAGALLIGDLALALDGIWSERFWRKDLGQWWWALTGLPMVYAVWAARSQWVKEYPQQFCTIVEALKEARNLGMGALLPLVVDEACRRTGLPEEKIQRYFCQELDFAWSTRHEQSLKLFKSLCSQHGLLPA